MITLIQTYVLPAADSVLPAPLHSETAHGLLLAIGWQESRFSHRTQAGGPARGFWQFEIGGVQGVLHHPRTATLAADALVDLAYAAADATAIHAALADNDVLAAVFARLLLWTVPAPLPTTAEAAWAYYQQAWRPGVPRPETWADAYHHGTTALRVT